MLRVTKLTDYATVILTHLAAQSMQFESATDIAQAVSLKLPTVSKILKLLVKKGFLKSQRGIEGGYALVLAPTAISIADIIRAVEGPVALTECSLQAGLCDHEAACKIRQQWQKMNQVVLNALASVTLADMVVHTKSI